MIGSKIQKRRGGISKSGWFFAMHHVFRTHRPFEPSSLEKPDEDGFDLERFARHELH
jgi:hypothetical protein